MYQLQDSITVQEPTLVAEDSAAAQRPARPQTPYQVLRMLPKNATPAQQDSAIQAWFQPGEIHYSDRPDTLHLPGHGVGRNLKDVNLPQYYRESFFSKDSLLHPEIRGGRYGIAGDPVPYTVRNDNIFSSALLICFVVAIVSFSATRNFIVRQLKLLFYRPGSVDEIPESGTELRFQLFLAFMGSILMSIAAYFYVVQFVAQTFILENDYYLICIFVGTLLLYFLSKYLLYSWVNLLFFDGKKNRQYLLFFLFLISLESIAFFPIVLLQVYFGLSVENALVGIIFILVLCKIMSFYKSWVIFFRQNDFVLQIFLYFCALEIMPVLALWGVLMQIVRYLEVIY